MSELTNAIVVTIGQPVLILEHDLRVAAANPAFLRTFRVGHQETEGRPLRELGTGQWDIPELERLLKGLLDGDGLVEDYRIEDEFEVIGRRTMLLNARSLLQAGYDRILLAISDVTEAERFEEELIARTEFAEKLIDSIREGLVVLQTDLCVERVNQSFCEIFEVDREEAEGRLIYEIGNGQWDLPDLRKALEEILPQKTSFNDFEVNHDFPEIGRRTMLLNARQLDHMPWILLAIRDETERRRYAESQKLMVGELQHRVKNILANVQSIASATLRRSRSLDEFRDAYMQRIQSLSRAQDLLMRDADGVADLHELLAREFSAHGWEEDGRLSLDGPRVTLSREQAQPVAMVVHELATNAVKYGAFSRPAGRLDVSWSVDEESRLSFEWQESGVEDVGPPAEKGFGTGMIEGSVGHMLGGESHLDFGGDGVTCRISFPLEPDIQRA